MDMSVGFPYLKLTLDYVPVSFQIFGIEVTIYGLLIAVGVLLGIAFVVLEARRANQDQNKYLDMMMLSLAGAVIGSRLFYVAFSWELYKSDPMEILNIRSGGYAFYGGLFAGILVAAVFAKLAGTSFWEVADLASMGILIAQIIGRWGDFFNRASFGEYTDGVTAMRLPLSAVRSGEVSGLMRDNLIVTDGISYIQVHPVFLYESLWCLLLLLMLLALRRKKQYSGQMFMIYLAGYGLGRFFFEWLRTDKLYIPGTNIGVSLVISAALFLIFTPVICVQTVLAKKRAAVRRTRREKFYQEEEQYEHDRSKQEKEAEITAKTVKKTEKAVKKAETEEQIQETKNGNTDGLKENDAEHPKDFPQEKKSSDSKENRNQKQSEEMENWEDSEYAHIPRQWRKAESKQETSHKS